MKQLTIQYERYIFGFISLGILIFSSCTEKKTVSEESKFTKADSLAERYLELQDSTLEAWNIMIYDDNRKIKAMHSLLHELIASNYYDKDDLLALEVRLQQLKNLRYSQKTMSNADIIEEYDFASNSLISEVVTLAESHPQFSENPLLQKLVNDIKAADQRVEIYRAFYDSAATKFNLFIEEHKEDVREIDHSNTLEKKPLFQIATDTEPSH